MNNLNNVWSSSPLFDPYKLALVKPPYSMKARGLYYGLKMSVEPIKFINYPRHTMGNYILLQSEDRPYYSSLFKDVNI